MVRFVASGGQVFALKEINERLARHEYRLLGEFEEEGLPTVSALGICVDRPSDQEAILVTRYLERGYKKSRFAQDTGWGELLELVKQHAQKAP